MPISHRCHSGKVLVDRLKLAAGCYLEIDVFGPRPVRSVCVDTVVVKFDPKLLLRLKAVGSYMTAATWAS
jgi:hypothetical protein